MTDQTIDNKLDISVIDEQLDALDNEIMQKYPEIENAWLHNAIAEKVKLELKRYNTLIKA